nr:hypothetical protein [Micromonospora sp. DSM 115978]
MSAGRPIRVVVMAAIPGQVRRGADTRTDLSYVPYANATWRWWCDRNRVEFILLDKPVEDRLLDEAPPPMHRWSAAARVLRSAPAGSQVAVVDADTMIRWDTPDFFALAGDSLAAVRARDPHWIVRSVEAYRSFFPGVSLPWWEYVNSGLVVFSTAHAHHLTALVDFYHRHRRQLTAVQQRSDAGVDQTLLNFVVRAAKEPVHLLPPPFNLLSCVPLNNLIGAYLETARQESARQALLHRIMTMPETFQFIEYAYVWHFTSSVATRREFMRETWRRVRSHYPGAPEPD